MVSSPLIAPGLMLGWEALVLGFSAFGLRISRLDRLCFFDIVFLPCADTAKIAVGPWLSG